MNQQSILNTIQVLALKEHCIEVVWLYGSRAKNTAEKNSDYDIAIALKSEQIINSRTAFFCDEIAYKWSGITGASLSVIDINHVPTPLAYSVISEGRVILCNNDLRLHSEQQRVWSLWESFKYEYKQQGK